MEGLVREEVPVEEGAGNRWARRRVERWVASQVGRVCSGWLEEEPGWVAVCKGEA